MNCLFLFITSCEGGAPGYLSSKGEQAAENLAENLYVFLTETLGLNFEQKFAHRAASLGEDLRWKTYKHPEQFEAALHASLNLFPQAAFIAGEHFRTLKTLQPLAERLALPVSVCAGLDRKSTEDDPLEKTPLQVALNTVQSSLLTMNSPPKLVLVGTSVAALAPWLQQRVGPVEGVNWYEHLQHMTQNNTCSAVVSGLMNFTESGQVSWTFDF
jgi:hypothetical protein